MAVIGICRTTHLLLTTPGIDRKVPGHSHATRDWEATMSTCAHWCFPRPVGTCHPVCKKNIQHVTCIFILCICLCIYIYIYIHETTRVVKHSCPKLGTKEGRCTGVVSRWILALRSATDWQPCTAGPPWTLNLIATFCVMCGASWKCKFRTLLHLVYKTIQAICTGASVRLCLYVNGNESYMCVCVYL